MSVLCTSILVVQLELLDDRLLGAADVVLDEQLHLVHLKRVRLKLLRTK
jgi:hypothetical protein